jgi:hypothetical protein
LRSVVSRGWVWAVESIKPGVSSARTVTIALYLYEENVSTIERQPETAARVSGAEIDQRRPGRFAESSS